MNCNENVSGSSRESLLAPRNGLAFAGMCVGLWLSLVLASGCTRQPPPLDVSQLAEKLSDEKSENRYEAVKEIENRAEAMDDAEAVLAVPSLREALRDSDARVRYRAAKALAKLRAASAPAVPELAAVLGDEDPQTRYYAAKALAKIGRPARPAMPQLLRALNDENVDVQYYAAKALGNIGPQAKESLASLQALAAQSRDPKVQEAAQGAIAKINTSE